MESMGNPNSAFGLELTIAIPGPGNKGSNISSSSGCSDGRGRSNIENERELALLDTLNHTGGRVENVDAQIVCSMDKEGEPERRMAGGSSSQLPKYARRLSQEQCDLLEASFQQNHYPDKEAREALAETLKVRLKQVGIWFTNRRTRFKKQKVEEKEKELDSYKKQVKSLTKETHKLRRKLKKLKKKLKKKVEAPPMEPQQLPAPALPQPQVMLLALPEVLNTLAGRFPNSERNMTTMADPNNSQQAAGASATTGLPATNALMLHPSSGDSKI